MRFVVGWIVVLGVLGVTAAHGGSVRLEPTSDATLFEDADGDTSSGAGPALFAGNNNQEAGRARRALIAFDVASALPAGAIVDSARLELHVSNVSDLRPRLMTIHRVTCPWGEGRSTAAGGAGAPAMPGDATWTCAFFPDRLWREPGGEFEANPSATLLVGGVASYVWTGAALAADVLSWLRQPAANFGWLLLGDEAGPGTARRFDSREHPDAAQRPTLTVHYSFPGPPKLTTWGGLKATYRRGEP